MLKEDSSFLTILTATYNRSHLLPRLYDSLRRQSRKDFVWLIIDDGSTDNTQSVVAQWIAEATVNIIYHKKANGGKHTAVNYGMRLVSTELVFILDSDDYIVDDAIQVIGNYQSKYSSISDKVCGFTFHQMTGGKINGGPFPAPVTIANYHKFQINKWQGDTAQVFFSEILKNHPFPEYPGKRRVISEDLIWIDIGMKYPTVYVREIITISEYQVDGLTNNLRASQNYYAQYKRGLKYLHPEIRLVKRLRGALMANVYSQLCGLAFPRPFLCLLMRIPSLVLLRIWGAKYNMIVEPISTEVLI